MTSFAEQPYIEPDPGLLEALGIEVDTTIDDSWAILAAEWRDYLHLEHRINLRLYQLKWEYSSSAAWEKQAMDVLGMPRRSLYEACNAARLLCRFPGHRDTLLRCGRSTCETLHKLSDEQFYQVASRWPNLHELTREAVRTIVADKLGKEPGKGKADPTNPAQLLLFDVDQLDIAREVKLTDAYLSRATSAIEHQLSLHTIDEESEATLATWLDHSIATMVALRGQLSTTTHGDHHHDDDDETDESPHEAVTQLTGHGQRQGREIAAARATA